MFLDEVAYEGMKVVMKMDKEARYWGRSGAPDGSTGTLSHRCRYTRYSRRYGLDRQIREPGIYEQDGTWFVKMDDPSLGDYEIDGKRTEYHFGSQDFDVHPDSKEEYDRRARELWYDPVITNKEKSFDEQKAILNNRQKVGDLPDTPIWELDEIIKKEKNQYDYEEELRFVVSRVNYEKEIEMQKETTYEITAYDREGQSCFSTHVREEDVEQVIRGNLWKQEHGLPLEFKSLKEEASFRQNMGGATDVVNPRTGNYHWELEDFIEAVKNDIVDCMQMSSLPFTQTPRIDAQRFHDRELGERLRQETIKGFDIDMDREDESLPRP